MYAAIKCYQIYFIQFFISKYFDSTGSSTKFSCLECAVRDPSRISNHAQRLSLVADSDINNPRTYVLHLFGSCVANCAFWVYMCIHNLYIFWMSEILQPGTQTLTHCICWSVEQSPWQSVEPKSWVHDHTSIVEPKSISVEPNSIEVEPKCAW